MLKNQDFPTRALLLALIYSVFWLCVHWFWVRPPFSLSWIFPQVLGSLLIYLSLNGLFASFHFYRWGRWIQPLVTIFYFQPVFQISYFQAYKTFLEQQNISLLLREPMFVLNVFAKELSFLQALLFLVIWAGLHFLNSFFLNREPKSETALKPYFLFNSKITWAVLILAIGSQIKWCLKHDPSQLIMRPVYPVVIFAVLSVFIFLFRTTSAKWKKAFWLAVLTLNTTQLYALNLGFPEYRDKMTLDAKFYRAFFGAYFVNTALGTLDQTEQAQKKFERLPKAILDYNVLVILDDSQRWDFSNQVGYPQETDRKLDWFYKQATVFQFPISPANFTDTAVPAFLTGIGSNRDVLEMKGNLVIWDYFAKSAETFFMATSPLDWSQLDLFYKSVGQKKLWSAASHSDYKGNPENVPDSYLVNQFKKYLSETKGPWVGTLQTFSSHYPYTPFPGAPQPYQPCDLTRQSGVENFKNCYRNGQISAAHAKDEILRSVDLSKTVVVMTSDHGEGMNEHGIWFHGVDYHQEMVKVPFILYIPPSLQAKIPAELWENFQRNSKRVTSTMDFVPTLMELHEIVTGQKLISGSAKNRTEDYAVFSGRSLFHSWDERVVFSSHCFPQYRCYSREIAFVTDEYYLLYRPSEGFHRIYSTFGDLNQEKPLDPRSIPREKLQRLVDQAAETHSIGQSMKAYFQNF